MAWYLLSNYQKLLISFPGYIWTFSHPFPTFTLWLLWPFSPKRFSDPLSFLKSVSYILHRLFLLPFYRSIFMLFLFLVFPFLGYLISSAPPHFILILLFLGNSLFPLLYYNSCAFFIDSTVSSAYASDHIFLSLLLLLFIYITLWEYGPKRGAVQSSIHLNHIYWITSKVTRRIPELCKNILYINNYDILIVNIQY